MDRADAFQRRHPILGYPIGVVYKFIDDQGAYLAALITYYGFLSVFPLLLLLQSVLGFFIHGNEKLHKQILDSVLGQIPVLGNTLSNSAPNALRGSVSAIVLGSIVALYGGLGVAQALQHTSNTCWAVPRNSRPNPILMRARSAAVLLFLGAALVTLGWLPQLVSVPRAVTVLVNLVLGTGIFLLLMKMTTARGRGWGRLAPGAFLVTLVWQVFMAGAGYFTQIFGARSSDTYGTYGSILTILIACYIMAVAFVVGCEVNVVAYRHLYPRSLMTQFTDDVELTLADQQAYAMQSQMQRFKNYQSIDVLFDKNDDGVADQPSDLDVRWHDAVDSHAKWLEHGHPRRPAGMWGLGAEPKDVHGVDGSE